MKMPPPRVLPMGIFSKFAGRPDRKKTVVKSEAVQKPKYRGVELVATGSDCCDAVRALENARFLDAEAPRLPLRDCDAPKCECVYRRFDDRRDEPRRIADVAYDIAGEIRQGDQRSNISSGRRDED